jgi:hypothetical protein
VLCFGLQRQASIALETLNTINEKMKKKMNLKGSLCALIHSLNLNWMWLVLYANGSRFADLAECCFSVLKGKTVYCP